MFWVLIDVCAGYTSPYAYSGYLPAMPTGTQLPQSLAELRPSSKRKGGRAGGGLVEVLETVVMTDRQPSGPTVREACGI